MPGTSGSLSGTLTCTGPGNPPAAPHACAQDRQASDRQYAGHPGPGLRHPGLAEPPHRAPVQLQLVDRLVGAGTAQLGRTVCGQYEQRHPRLVGFDHGSVELRGGRARRAQQQDRLAARLGQAEREERGTALVDTHVQPHVAARQRSKSASASGALREPGRQHRLAQAAPD